MSKLPSLQFYPGDWRKDPGVQSLSYEERGIWIEMLFLMHESEQRGKLLLSGKPIAPERLANMLRLDLSRTELTIERFLSVRLIKKDPETGILTKVAPYVRLGQRPSIPSRLRREILSRGFCQKCGRRERLTIDHIFPYSLGGESSQQNLQCLCWYCNRSKGPQKGAHI